MKKKIAEAPKFALHLFGAGYLSNRQGLSGIRFTNNIKEAQLFAVGFDDPEQKLSVWNAAAKLMFNSSLTVFEVEYL